VATLADSRSREVRLQVSGWPGEPPSSFLAVVQYAFVDSNPAMSCLSIGLLAHISFKGKAWKVEDQFLLATNHHSSIQSARLLNPNGAGRQSLLVESSLGGAGVFASSLQIFDLTGGKYSEVLHLASRVEAEDEILTQLDLNRTAKFQGTGFCFVRTTLAEKGIPIRPPKVDQVCEQKRTGVDAAANADRNQMLNPLATIH
jgi:hypothetical protein